MTLLRALAFILWMAISSPLLAMDLPWWVDSIDVSPPGVGGIGAVTLNGTWIDTGAPDAISHSILDGRLHLTVAAPNLNVITGDALTPWTLTEEFGPVDPLVNEITGSIFSVDPANRGIRELVSGPDFLGWIYPPPRGEFHGLGSLGGPNAASAAFDVSANGNVVTGRSAVHNSTGTIRHEAFAWSESTGMIPLGFISDDLPASSTRHSTGFGVSADGNYIVGDSTALTSNNIERQEAFRWSLGTGMQGLGTLQDGFATSQARATSRNGRVVVGVDEFFPPTLPPIASGQFRSAFRYTDETGIENLGFLPQYGSGSASEAVDVTANGRLIAGNAFRDPFSNDPVIRMDQAQPFLWAEEGGMKGLGNPARNVIAIYPPPRQETLANAISSDGEVVVGVDTLEWDTNVDPISQYPFRQAVRWTEENGWQDLRPFRLPPGPQVVGSEAVDVSAETGSVIGQAFLVATDATNPDWLEGDVDGFGRVKVPFIWDRDRGMRPLARVLAGDYGLDFEGWRLNEATAISDDGTTIVGVGRNPDGVTEAWRAVLYRNTRMGDANFDGQVDQFDVAALSANMGMNSDESDVYWEYGDFDQDGVVGPDDLDLLVANYDGRAVGDFNADGYVDMADYTVWRNQLGSETGIADGTGDGLVTHDDYQVWRQNFGTTLTGNLSAAAVPEPTGLMLTLIGLGGLFALSKHRLLATAH